MILDFPDGFTPWAEATPQASRSWDADFDLRCSRLHIHPRPVAGS
jgi:hypothetical protein